FQPGARRDRLAITGDSKPGLEPHRRGHQYPGREWRTEHLAFLGTGWIVAPGSLRSRGGGSPPESTGDREVPGRQATAAGGCGRIATREPETPTASAGECR